MLAPVADFANHSQQPNAVFFLHKRRGSFQLVALQARGACGQG